MTTKLSKCCGAGFETINGNEGTSYYACLACGKPCDPRPCELIAAEGKRCEGSFKCETKDGVQLICQKHWPPHGNITTPQPTKKEEIVCPDCRMKRVYLAHRPTEKTAEVEMVEIEDRWHGGVLIERKANGVSIPVPSRQEKGWEERFDAQSAGKVADHVFDGSCCYNDNEGGKGHSECRYPYNPGRENASGPQCLKLKDEHFNIRDFIASELARERKEGYEQGYQEATEKAGHHFIYEEMPAKLEQARKEGAAELAEKIRQMIAAMSWDESGKGDRLIEARHISKLLPQPETKETC